MEHAFREKVVGVRLWREALRARLWGKGSWGTPIQWLWGRGSSVSSNSDFGKRLFRHADRMAWGKRL